MCIFRHIFRFGTLVILLSACSTLDFKLGGSSGAVTGSAGPNGSTNAPSQLSRCPQSLGTVAVVEDDFEGGSYPGDGGYGYYVQYAREYNLPKSVVPLVRLMAQQSNCFRIVDRHRGLATATREIGLAEQGYLRKGSKISRGQLREADYNLVPTLAFSENSAGALGAVIGGIAGSLLGSPTLGGAFGGLRFKEAQVTLALVDNRTGEQISIAEGSASKADLGGGLAGYYDGAAGGVGGWQNSNEAKVVSAAFLDAMSKLVQEVQSIGGRYSQR